MIETNINFNYVPLSFVSTQAEFKRQLKNTMIMKYVLNTFNNPQELSKHLEDTRYGFTDSAKEEGTHKFLRISDIKDGSVDWGAVPYCNCENDTNYLLRENDVLIARTGGTTGKSFLIKEITAPSVYASYLIRLRATSDLNPQFLYLFLNSYMYWNQIVELKQGSAQPNVNAEKLKGLVFPYCDLDTQEKLISLVCTDNNDSSLIELSGRINHLEMKIESLEQLNNLFNKQKSLNRNLRQSIFQEAIQGKLVPQDPNDEPASILLENIKVEKEKLIRENKSKKEKPFPPINEDEIPYQLPQGWQWVRFQDVTINRDGERIPVSKENREKRLKIYDYYGASGVIDKIDSYLFDKPLLLIGEDGANLINRSTPIAFIAEGQYWVNNHAHVIDAIDYVILRYLEIYINSINLEPYVTGTAQPKMNQAKLNSICVAFPPLKEQKRIIEKVGQIMGLITELEMSIEQSKKDSEILLQSVLQEAFDISANVDSEVELINISGGFQ